MSRSYNHIEKIISVLLIIWGGLCLYMMFESIDTLVKYGVQRKMVSPGLPIFFRVLIHFNTMILLSFASIISGICLLLNKKTGWAVAVIVFLTEALIAVSFLFSHKSKLTSSFDTDNNIILFGIFWFVIFATLLTVMLLKPFRLKYSPTVATYLTIIGVAGLLLVDYSY